MIFKKPEIFIFIIALVLFCVNCTQKNSSKNIRQKQKVIFCNVVKDSIFVEKYFFDTVVLANKKIFKYTSLTDSMSFEFDSLNKSLRRTNGLGTAYCTFENRRYFIQNSKISSIYLFTENIGSQDGEISYYFDTQKGLILEQAISWKSYRFYQPSDSVDYSEVQSILFKIVSGATMQNFY